LALANAPDGLSERAIEEWVRLVDKTAVCLGLVVGTLTGVLQLGDREGELTFAAVPSDDPAAGVPVKEGPKWDA
jgi:hypothetical protein